MCSNVPRSKDRDELLTIYDFPAQHWQSIRTSNPIESAFATIRHRTKRTKGCLSRDGMLHIPLIALLHKTTVGQWMFKLGARINPQLVKPGLP